MITQEPRDRPADEIEVTEAMIEAGDDVLLASYSILTEGSKLQHRQLLETVFRAMAAAQPKFV